MLDALAGKIPGLIVGSIVSCTFAVVWLSLQSAPWTSLVWLYVLIGLNLPLALVYRHYDQADEARKFRIARLMTGSRVLLGLVWSVGFTVIYQLPDPDLFWFLIAVYFGIALSVVATQSLLPMAVVGFLLPPALTLLALVVARMDWMAVLLAGGWTLCFGSFLSIVRMLYLEGLAAARNRLELQAANQALQRKTHELGTKTDLLEQTTARLDRLVHLRDMVLAAASHDLRQPAQSISLIARSLQAESTIEGVREQAQALESASSHINGLISRLLDLARSNEEDRTDRAAWIDLDALLADTGRIFQPLARLRHVKLLIETNSGASVWADRHYLERLLHNLLTNAIEHSGGTRVAIEARIVGPSGAGDTTAQSRLVLRIADDGVGIDPDALPADLVAEAPAGERPARVSGPSGPRLGMLIVARLASLSGLRVRYLPGVNSGATFAILFDAFSRHPIGEPARPVKAVVRNIPAPGGAAQSILVIDDDRLIRYGLEVLLQAQGFRVWSWDGMDDSMDLAPPGEPPSLVIVDWQLDRTTTALKALARVRHWLPPSLPVLVVAGTEPTNDQLAQLRRLIDASAVSVLHKPVHGADIEAHISRMLSLAGA